MSQLPSHKPEETSPVYGRSPDDEHYHIPPLYKKIALFIIGFICFFCGQICELCGPFFLVAGAIWLLLPWLANQLLHLTSTTDIQTHNAIMTVSNAIPHNAVIGGYQLSGKQLIIYGLIFIAIASICASINNLPNRKS